MSFFFSIRGQKRLIIHQYDSTNYMLVDNTGDEMKEVTGLEEE